MMSRVIKEISEKFEIVLASSSPRRYEIVTQVMGFADVKLMKPSFAEDHDKSLYAGNPTGYVHDTSKSKALGIIEDLKHTEETHASKPKLVICADTVVIDSDENIHEKPQRPELQLGNLLRFRESDGPVKVITSVTLIKWESPQDFTFTQFEEVSEVHFDSDFPLPILYDYVDSGDALDVAGGFKVQSFGGAMIKKINGDFFNVVGLPLNKTFKELYKAAFPLE